jgi:hypothetical protein
VLMANWIRAKFAPSLVNVIRPFNCGSLSSSSFSNYPRHGGSARAVGAGQNCGDGACAADRCFVFQVRIVRTVDVFAGVMVLSEVAQRLMMMSGSGASTSAAECGQAAASRMNEVAATPSQRDIASPAARTRNYKISQASVTRPQSNDVPSTQIQ